MQYQIEEIRQSQLIFYKLLENKQLASEQDRDLYYAYMGNENVATLVKSQGELAGCQVGKYGNTIYLIPNEENSFLGYSKRELKNILCKSKGTDKDYYLSQFVVLTILTEFHDANGVSSKGRDFMRVGDLQNLISERLKEGSANYTEEEQGQHGIAFSNMLEAFEALRSDDRGAKTKTTKEGFLHHIFKFLQDQGLIDYLEIDELIKTTKKLDQFMDFNLLNRNHFQRVLKVLEVADEQNQSSSNY